MTRRSPSGMIPPELLAALAVLSLVIAMLYSGLRLATHGWESAARTRAAVSELREAASFVRAHAAQAVPLAISDSNAWQLWFEGDGGRLVFVVTAPAHHGAGGTYELTLAIESQNDGAALTVSRRLLHPDATPGTLADGQPRALVTGLESAEFSYFGTAGEGIPPSWHASWEGRQRLPRLLRLRLVSRSLGPWPDIEVRLPTDDNRYQRSLAPMGPRQALPAPDPGQ